MAALSRAVIQLPDFAEMAYKKSLADEERRLRDEEKQERKVAQRQREADAFGVKQSYYEKSFALESGAKRVADEAYKLFQQAGIDYEKTGSEEAKIRMEKAAGQFNQVVGAGLAVSNAVNQEFETFKKNPSAFTAESQKIANQAYSDRKNIDFQPVIENGMIFINEKGKKVPITESIYFSANLQPGYNTLGLVPVDPATKYLDPRDYASLQVNNFKDTDGVRVDDGRNIRYNQSALTTKARSSYESDLNNNPSLMEAVILRHSTASSGNPPTPQQRANIIAEYNSNPELLKAAKDNYFKEVTSFIPQFMPAMQRGVAPTGGQSDDMTRNQRNELLALVEGSRGDFIKSGTFAGQKEDRYMIGNTDYTLEVPDGMGGKKPLMVTGMGINRDGTFVATIRDGEENVSTEANKRLLIKELTRKGLYEPLIGVMKARIGEYKTGSRPSGY
jgi:hypothetical protein